jgi:hypothetical protein
VAAVSFARNAGAVDGTDENANAGVENPRSDVVVDGIVRQDGLGTPAALCTLIGTVLRVD